MLVCVVMKLSYLALGHYTTSPSLSEKEEEDDDNRTLRPGGMAAYSVDCEGKEKQINPAVISFHDVCRVVPRWTIIVISKVCMSCLLSRVLCMLISAS